MSNLSGIEPEEGAWDFDGSCAPYAARYGFETFSVGVFQWLPKRSGRGLKRGPVVKRFGGRTEDAQAVYQRARDYIALLHADT